MRKAVEYEFPDVGSAWSYRPNDYSILEYFICVHDTYMKRVGGAEFSDIVQPTSVSECFGLYRYGNDRMFNPTDTRWVFYAKNIHEFMNLQANELIEKNMGKIAKMKKDLAAQIKNVCEANEANGVNL